MLNFFKNNINKKVVNIAFSNKKSINNYLIKTINKNFLFNANNQINSHSNLLIKLEIENLKKKQISKFSLKNFTNIPDSNESDKSIPKAAPERRRLGKQRDSSDEVLKKKIEDLKNLEKEEIEKPKLEEKDKVFKSEETEKLINDKSKIEEIKKEQTSDSSDDDSKFNKEQINKNKEKSLGYNNIQFNQNISNSGLAAFSIDKANLSNEEKEIYDRIHAKILGDLKRLDASKKFNSQEINELYEIIAKIKGTPPIKEKKYEEEIIEEEIDMSNIKIFLISFEKI